MLAPNPSHRTRLAPVRGLPLVIVLFAVFASPTVAQVIRVPQDQPTIQAGIDAAQHGYTVLVADGTYRGSGNVSISFRGKRITVRSENGPSRTIIDADRSPSVFVFNSGEMRDSILAGFSIIRAGRSGIHCARGASPTIRDCIIRDNWNGLLGGGGLFSEGGASPLLEDCIISDNLASMGGGVLCDAAEVTLVRCVLNGNRVDLFGGAGVGGMNASRITLIDCILNDNHSFGFSGNGGGLLINSGTATVVNTLFHANSSSFIGGAISITGNASAEIVNATMTRNTAVDMGGAIYINGDALIANSIMWDNLRDEIHVAGGSPEVRYSIVRGGWTGPGNLSVDPRFVNPDRDFRLAAGSPAIDAGDNDAVLAWVMNDLDGNRRFLDDPRTQPTGNGLVPVVDMGAYEYVKPGVFLTLHGSCPGRMAVEWSDATPNRHLGIAFARNTGRVTVVGTCSGTILGLGTQSLRVLATTPTGPDGRGHLRGNAPPSFCGGYVQIVVADGSPCDTSNVERVVD